MSEFPRPHVFFYSTVIPFYLVGARRNGAEEESAREPTAEYFTEDPRRFESGDPVLNFSAQRDLVQLQRLTFSSDW